jgi:hypothetical protein
LIDLTRKGDIIVGLCNTTAGQSTGSFTVPYSAVAETPPHAIDNDTSTKYYNYWVNGCSGCPTNQPGVNSGFFVLPSISNATVARALLFATGNDCPERDPITVTLEGSNATSNATLNQGLQWTLIYNGTTGIDPTVNTSRLTYVIQQNFPNTQAFASYRVLVTSKRSSCGGVQYSEARILGYV